jgi:hypothetical protein
VVLRTLKDSRQGLSALRVGTLDAFFVEGQGSEDKAVLAASANDDTLWVRSCFSYSVVVRRGLNLECQPRLQLASVRYQGVAP